MGPASAFGAVATMAIADVAVEIGPRNRRRAFRGAVGLGVIAAIFVWGGGGSLLTGSGNHSRSSSSSGPHGSSVGTVYAGTLYPITQKLVFGMNERKVFRVDGRPTKIVRDQTGQTCWQYAVNQTYHGLRGPSTLNNVRVCFYGGLYTANHYEFDGKWDYGLPPKITVP